MPGLTLTGLETATLNDIRDLVSGKWREAFGASWDLSDLSPDGQLIGISSERWALPWELLDAIISGMDPDKATGFLLVALAAITGTVPLPATFSSVELTICGLPTSTINADSLASTASTGQQWRTAEDVTLVAATAWVGSTSYFADDRRENGGNIYLCVTPGVSAVSGGPTGVDPDPDSTDTDGTAEWRFLGEGTGFADVLARATVSGPIVAVAGDIIGIDTPVGGWTGVTNILDATVGRDKMTDSQLRVLRELELSRPGTSPADAIRVALLDLGQTSDDPVLSVVIFPNNTDFTDADGVPPHSLEALVSGGDDQEIWDALLANVAAGIRTHGTEVGAALDSSGVSQTMKFSRPTEVNIYVSVTLVKNALTYPADGDDQVKAAIATWGNALDGGSDIVSAAVLAQVFKVAGLLDCALPLISAAPITVPVATTTIVLTSRQRGLFDTTRISVTASNGAP